MNYTKNALRKTTIYFAFTVIGALAAYLFKFFLARNLQPAEYGLFWAIYASVFFFTFLIDLGLGSALVKFIPEFQIKQNFSRIKGIMKYVMQVQSVISILGGLIIFFSAEFLATNYFKDPTAVPVIQILAIVFALFPFNTLYNALHGFQNMFAFSLIGCLKNVFVLIITVLLFQGNPTPLRAAYAYVMTYLLLPFFALYFLQKVNFPNIFATESSITKPLKKKLLAFGFPILLTTIGTMLIAYSDTMILTYFRTLEEVGLYNVALPLAMTLWLAVSSINAVILPMSSEMWSRGHKKSLQTGIASLYRYILLALIPVALLLIAFPEVVITLLFAQKYSAAATALRILTVGSLLGSLALLNNSVLSGIGKPKIVSKIMSTAVVVNIGLNIVLIPLYGNIGAASATTFSYTFMFIASLYFIEKIIYVGIPTSFWIKMGVNGGFFLFIMQYLKSILEYHPILEAIIAVTAAGVVYVIVAYLVKLINIPEIKSLIKHLVKKG